MLPTISKVFENVVQEQLTEFLNVNTLLYDSQYGFRHVVQEFYAQKGPFTKQIATEGFSTVFGQLMFPYNILKV